jgi:hypothetical protein
MGDILPFRKRHLLEIERTSSCRTWRERFFVEVRAVAVDEALEQVLFSLSASETIVSPSGSGSGHKRG